MIMVAFANGWEAFSIIQLTHESDGLLEIGLHLDELRECVMVTKVLKAMVHKRRRPLQAD